MTGAAPAWIALDWGTTNLRAWAMDAASEVLAEAQSDRGMGRVPPGGFEAALLESIAGWELTRTTPVIACGMVGARQGWTEAAYVPAPCAPLSPELTRAPVADERLEVWIVPGLSQSSPPDVMRGEETQIAGFLTLNPDFDGVICLPGSHTKWVRISAGEVVSFQTAMTGELFAAITGHTVLRHSTAGDGWEPEAFAEAVSDAISRPETLATRLFRLRAEGLLSGMEPGRARAQVSGLLIGAELAAARPYWLGMPVALIGAKVSCNAYAQALSAQGLSPMRTRDDALTLAGLKAAYRNVKDETR